HDGEDPGILAQALRLEPPLLKLPARAVSRFAVDLADPAGVLPGTRPEVDALLGQRPKAGSQAAGLWRKLVGSVEERELGHHVRSPVREKRSGPESPSEG